MFFWFPGVVVGVYLQKLFSHHAAVAVRCVLVNQWYFSSGIVCYTGYIVLPLSQIGAEMGRQHWYPALLSTYPPCQLSVVRAAAAPVLPIVFDGGLAAGALGEYLVGVVLVLSVTTLLVAAVEGTGVLSLVPFIGDWCSTVSVLSLLPCNVLLSTNEFSCADGFCLLLGPSGLFSTDGKSSSQSAPQP